MKEFKTWCFNNTLVLNTEKTVCIEFENKRKTNISNDTDKNGSSLKFSDSAKFLGLYLDNNMSWQTHLDYTCKKVNSAYYAILQLKSKLDASALLNVYYALVYSVLSYNVIFWGSAVGCGRLLIAQKRIIRLIFNLRPLESCKPIFKQNKLLTFPSIYIFRCLIFIKTNINKFQVNGYTHTYDTRNFNDLRLQQHKLLLMKKPALMPEFFNKLPENIKSIPCIKKYKNKVREYLIDLCCYHVNEYF